MEKFHLFSNTRAMKHFFAQNYAEGFLPSAKSIAEFLDFILRVENKRKIPPFLRHFYLYQAIQANSQNTQKLGSFAKNFTQFLLNSPFFLRFYDELCTECILIESLEKLDIYAFYDDHLEILKAVFKNYQEILTKHQFFDKYFLEDYQITFELLKGFDAIIIHLEGFLSQFEMQVFHRIAEHLPITFKLTLDSFNQEYYTKLFGLSLGLGIYEIVLFRGEFSFSKTESRAIHNPHKLQVLEFQDKIAEIGGIFTQIDLWLEQGITPEQICIVLPNEEFAQYLKLFDKARNFNYAMGNALKECALYRSLKNSLQEKKEPNSQDEASQEECRESQDSIAIPNFQSFEEFKEFLQNLEANSKESQTIKEKFLEGLEQFGFALKYLMPLSVQEQILVFLNMLGEVTLDDIGGGRISVMGILETRGISFDYLIIPEFNAGNVPSFNDKDLFLNTVIRERVGLPTRKNRENLQKHYYAQILQKSREARIMCLNNDEDKPSLFLLESSIFGRIPHFKASLNYGEYFLSGKALNYQECEIIAPLEAESFSATSLQCFLTCPRKYYYRYVLGFKELAKEGVNIGSKIHNALKEVYCNAQQYAVDSMYQEVCARMEESHSAKESFESALAKKYLKNFFEAEKARLEDGWIPFRFEQEFRFNLSGFLIKGRIDRIDKRGEEVCVLDYKYKRNLKVESKNYEKALDFQLPLYALAVQKGAIECLENPKQIQAGFYDLYNAKILQEQDLNAKIEALHHKLEEISKNSKEVNFALTSKRETCQYCDFIYLCNRY
ncbi:MAG: PD-(D/E)XK nuclease family protein [Helicobacter sp.]|nr:PD-(D/E)XK nuclease family protein [Helicobacter sp.]